MMPDEPMIRKPIEEMVLPLLTENTRKLTRIETVLLGVEGTGEQGLVGKVEQIRQSQQTLEHVVGEQQGRLNLIDERCEERHNPGQQKNSRRWGLWTLGSGIGAGIAGIAWAIWERLK